MKHNQHGAVNVLLIPLIVAVVILVVVLIFATSAYSGEQNYKNNVSQKVAAAVAVAKQQESATLSAQFAQEEKSPLDTYTGPEAYGSVTFTYPKTWSAYVNDTGGGSALIDGYFHPGVIPTLSDSNATFALRLQVVNTPYNQTVQSFTSGQQNGQDTVSPYQLAKVPSVIGVEVTGNLQNGSAGTMVIFPIRSESLVVWTDSTQFLSDFNSYILPSLSFSP